MVDDWTWFFTSEGGRDRLLRDEIEGLQSASSAAHRQSSRLSSQLAQLQGSIESRLSALSAAFDAYVELGDVREQLAAFPDTRDARRDVVEAIETMAAGAQPEPLATGDSVYWLPYATNAVIALHRGDDAAPDRDRALTLARESDLYVTAAAGALGHAAAVGHRVPGLLVGDGTLTQSQEALWSAVLAGTYGDVWAKLDGQWREAVADDTPLGGRCADASGSRDPVDQLRWLRALIDGVHASPPDDSAVRTGLRGIVTELVAQGVGEEAELLARSRRLRLRIENPTASPESTPSVMQGRTVTTAVVDAFLSGEGDATARRWLTRWLAPSLTRVIAELETAVAEAPAALTSTRTPGGELTVTAAGPDPARLPVVLKAIEDYGTVPPLRLQILTALTGVLALLALVVALATGSGWAVGLIVAAAGCGIAAGIALRDRMAGEKLVESDLARTHQVIDDAKSRAATAETSRRLAQEETRQLAGSLRASLTQD